MIVLVVEDNPVSAKLLEQILRGAGHDVFTASGRVMAWQVLEAHPAIQLIVCDIDLPDGSGLDLVSGLRSNGYHTELPIIMCTGADDPESVKAAVEAGCTGYLLKPINPVRLLERVSAVAAAAAPGPA